VPDARRFQPRLSEGICLIIEKMLAKNRDDRYGHWQELISDLQLVRSRRQPLNARLPRGRSTMHRYEAVGPNGLPIETHVPHAPHLVTVRPRQPMMTPVMWAGLIVIIACLAGMAVLWKVSSDREAELMAELASRQMESQAAAAARAYYEAMEFSRNHPSNYAEIIRRFDAIIRNYPNTEFAPVATEQATQWRQKLAAAQQGQARLAPEAEAQARRAAAKEAEARRAAAKEQQVRDAAAAARVIEERRLLAEQTARAREAAQTAYNEFVSAWLPLLARRDYAGAIQLAQEAAADKRLAPLKLSLVPHVQAAHRLRAFVNKLAAADSPLIGKTVALSHISGKVTGVSTKGAGVIIEKIAGVGIAVPLASMAPDDLLRLAAVTVAPTDTEAQINYALLLLAEGYIEPAQQSLTVNPAADADPFEAMALAVIGALGEAEAPTYITDLRVQIAANQWPAAFARMLALDTRFAGTAAVKAAAAELAAARDQLLSLPPDLATAEPAARLSLIAAASAAENGDWARALAIAGQLEALLGSGTLSASTAATVQSDLDDLRDRLVNESGLPAADGIRRREVQRAGGRVWQVLADGSGDAKDLAEAVAGAKDGDGIELGPGRHDVSLVDGAGKQALYLYGSNGSMPVLTDAGARADAARPGNSLLRCGNGWRIENLHFQFSVNALAQGGANLQVANCAFTRPATATGPGLVIVASCDGGWQTTLENSLFIAAAADLVCSLPQNDGATRHKVGCDQCTLWLPDGAIHTTGQPELRRQALLSLQNSIVLAQRIAAASWPPALFTASFSYTGNNNLFFLARPADDTPALGDPRWNTTFPGQDTASVTNELTAAIMAGLKASQPVPALGAFARFASGDLRLGSKGPWATLADDKGVVGVRWPAWRWTAFLKPPRPAKASKAK
jgi:hypothetical protein